MKKALIDTDSILWRACYTAQQRKPTIEPNPDFAIHITRTMVRTVIDTLRQQYFPSIKELEFYIGSENRQATYRHRLSESYKANRLEKALPECMSEVREFIKTTWGAEEAVDEEADDVVGYKSQVEPTKTIIVSVDKDLRMLPGLHWECNDTLPFYVSDPGLMLIQRTRLKNPDSKTGTWKMFGTGLKWFYWQILTGDASDNIKRNFKYKNGELQGLLHKVNSTSDEQSLWALVCSVYCEKGSDVESAELNGKLLWIRRVQGELWQPPKM